LEYPILKSLKSDKVKLKFTSTLNAQTNLLFAQSVIASAILCMNKKKKWKLGIALSLAKNASYILFTEDSNAVNVLKVSSRHTTRLRIAFSIILIRDNLMDCWKE